MTQVAIFPASQISFDDLLAAFNAGYEGYIVPLRLTAEQFQAHLDNHDIDLDASRISVLGDQVVGAALLGKRGTRGWVGGIGIVPAQRNHGVGRQLMGALLDSARVSELGTVQLEVIVGNDAAYHLYQTLGFQTLRRLLILERSPALVVDSSILVETAPATEALEYYERLHATPNPWQRERETLLKRTPQLSGWMSRDNGKMVAYGVGVATAQNISWADLAGDNDEALHVLVSHVHGLYPDATARFVNLAEDDPAWHALSTLGYREVISQWEMQLAL